MSDLATTDAETLGSLFRARSASPVEALEAVLARLDLCEGDINAFAHVDRDRAMAAARASEARYLRGEARGPLDGVPVSIKDMLLTIGMPTRKGSRTTDPDAPQDTDAPSVARLRAAGAILYGKTTTTEFGGSPYSRSPLTGDTRSPWNLGYGCAGSSMGAAAQLGAGIGTLALGNDAAGSIRMPASFGGCFGIKPTFGLVANWPPSSAGILGHTGPMGWGVRETARMLCVIAGPDARDPYALPRLEDVLNADPDDGVAGLKVAYSPTLGLREPEPEVRAATDAAAATFEALGATVTEADPDLTGLFEAYDCLRIVNRASAYKASGAAAQRDTMDELVARVLDQASAYRTEDYVRALAARERLAAGMRAFHERFDILITPTMATPPLPIGAGPGPGDEHWYQIDGKVWSPYTFAFNMTHQPAASIPCGLTRGADGTAAGLPIGLQIVGPIYRDDLVLRAARAFEASRVWQRPSFPFKGAPVDGAGP
ncbi:MAG: amidase family protein [Devosia sp.]